MGSILSRLNVCRPASGLHCSPLPVSPYRQAVGRSYPPAGSVHPGNVNRSEPFLRWRGTG